MKPTKQEKTMKVFKNPIGTTFLAAALVGGGYFGGTYLLETAQFAHAQQQVEATREQLAQIEDLATVFRHVGKSVEPSVVNIIVEKQVPGMRQPMPFDDETLRRFFPDNDGDGEPDLPPGLDPENGDAPFRQQGNGSGVIMEVENGSAYILTNNHVAGGAEKMIITLNDGRKIENGKVIGADPKTDLAVIRVEVDNVIAAPWGNSDELQKGDWIMAFGSPFGYVGSMTHGIVSALNRDNVGILGSGGYENFIQVDAPINPGNSGGPLVNIRGQVVGINTAIASRTGGFQGIGFAIPSNQAKMVYTQLRTSGKVTRGWLGVSIRDVSASPDLARSFGFDGKSGVLVDQTFPETPAYEALEAGDIITQLNGKNVDDMQALRNAIAATPPGNEVTMQVFRGGKEQQIKLKVGEQPEDVAMIGRRGGGRGEAPSGSAQRETAGKLGVALADVTPDAVQRYSLGSIEKGAVITRVDPRSPAAEQGLRPGDVITRVGGDEVADAASAIAALKDADLAKGVRLYVQTRDGARFVFIKTDAE
jgi:serine protease Do